MPQQMNQKSLEEDLNYDKLNFHDLTGDHQLDYEDVPCS